MSDDHKHKDLLYTHSNAKEMQAFLAKIRSKARKESKKTDAPNVLAVYLHAIEQKPHGLDADKHNDANATLYDMLIDNINNDTLILTLSNSYKDAGDKAIKHIRDAFMAGGNEDKESVAADDYKEKLESISSKTKVAELTEIFNDLHALRVDLEGSPRAINAARYCSDIIDAVSNISSEHRAEVRYHVDKLSASDRYEPAKVQDRLEGAIASITKLHEKQRKESTRNALAVHPVHPVHAAITEVNEQLTDPSIDTKTFNALVTALAVHNTRTQNDEEPEQEPEPEL